MASEPLCAAPSKPPRTWGPVLLWTVGILLALGLAWFVGAVVYPVYRTRAVVDDFWRELRCGPDLPPAEEEKAVKESVRLLGGPERAAGNVRLYLALPDSLALHKMDSLALLGGCGRHGSLVLADVLAGHDSRLRDAAISVLGSMGNDAREAIPALRKLSASAADYDIVLAVEIALKKIEGEGPKP